MTNIKFSHSGGESIVNLDQVCKIEKGTTAISFYMNNTAYTYNFSTADDVTELISKIEKITATLYLDKITPQ